MLNNIVFVDIASKFRYTELSRLVRPVTHIYIYPYKLGNLIMKKIIAILSTVAGLSLGVTAYATDHHAAQALEHAAIAETHGEEGHAKVVAQHAKTALEHAKAAEKEHADAHTHSTAAVKSLEDAIKHADLGHAPEATKAAKEAVDHIKQAQQIK